MTDVTGALPGGEMMITVGLYCEVEDPDKFSEPFLFHLLGDSGGPFEFETRQKAEEIAKSIRNNPYKYFEFIVHRKQGVIYVKGRS